ncbi:MAG TPA: type VI secretion system tube protein Hcp [Thermoleophilaceae bacterium]|jgi:type VI secretion system secreted protein Hcp
MAYRYFLKIDGIPGDSTDASHEGEIEVLTWTWGEDMPPPEPSGGGTKVRLHDLSFTARLSGASLNLQLACATGRRLSSAVLAGSRDGKVQAAFLRILLTDVVISSYRILGEAGADAPSESVALTGSRVEVEYRELRPDGKLADPITAGWDSKLNRQV